MLETIREFASEQAMQRGGQDEMRAAHAAFFADSAEAAASHVMGSDKGAWLDRLEEDHDNFRAAMTWAIAADATETALRLGAALWRFWQMRGHLAEGLERVTAALALADGEAHPKARADALSAAAGLAYWLADGERSRGLYQEEIQVRQFLGDRAGLAEAHYGISFTWSVIDLQNPESASFAEVHVSEALAIFRELDDAPGVGRCEWALANVAWGTGKVDQAREHALHAFEIFESIKDSFMIGWASYTLGLAALSADQAAGGDIESRTEARRRLSHALRIFAEAQDVTGYALVIDALGLLAMREGDRERAARLSGAVSRLERISGTGLTVWNRGILGFDSQELRDDASLSDALASGEALSTDEAVAYALET
jgi:tetratricopeptide (TPR) repeat protein